MNDWLVKIRPPKYLRYFFFITYSWYRPYKSERSIAHYNAAIFLAIPHLAIPFILDNVSFIIKKGSLTIFSSFQIICFAVTICIIHYFWFIHKKKWLSYVEEFSYLKRNKRQIGSIYLCIYLCISLILALLPIVLLVFFDIDLRDR